MKSPTSSPLIRASHGSGHGQAPRPVASDEPYSRRRELLEEAVVPGGMLGTSTSIPKSGKALLKAAKDLGLAGVIAKKLSSTYEPGPSEDWVEIPG
jgi:ATP-dependent DNA ligase